MNKKQLRKYVRDQISPVPDEAVQLVQDHGDRATIKAFGDYVAAAYRLREALEDVPDKTDQRFVKWVRGYDAET